MYLQIQKAFDEIQILRGLKQKSSTLDSASGQGDFQYESVRPNQHFYRDNFDSFNEQHRDFDFKVFRRAYSGEEEFEGFKRERDQSL